MESRHPYRRKAVNRGGGQDEREKHKGGGGGRVVAKETIQSTTSNSTTAEEAKGPEPDQTTATSNVPQGIVWRESSKTDG